MDLTLFIAIIMIVNLFWLFYIRQHLIPNHKKEIEETVVQRIKQSKAVIKGKVTEHLVPWMDGFDFNPSDARFLGSPIDLIIFDGLTEGNLKRIVILEVKTGQSQLTTRERQIRDAVNEGKVEYELLRVGG